MVEILTPWIDENKTNFFSLLSNEKIKTEEKEFCKVQVTYRADSATVITKRKEIIEKFQKETSKMTLPGFRKGKASLDAIRVHFSKQIEDATQNEMLSLAENEILFETKMKTLFAPQVLHSHLLESSFECSLMFFKRPPIQLKQYKDFKIPKPHQIKSQGEMVESLLQSLSLQYGDTIPYQENDFVQKGDKITMDVKCTIETDIIDEFTKEGIFYEVGKQPEFYPNFDDNIQGMSIGEIREFRVNWQNDQFATFYVTLHMGVKIVPAALDDEFAKKLELETLANLQKNVEGVISNKIQELENQEMKQQVISRILSEHDFEIPQWLVSLDLQQFAMQCNLDLKTIDEELQKKLMTEARDRVKLTLILETIKDIEPEMQFSENEIINFIRSTIEQQGQDPNKFLVEVQKTGKLFGLVAGCRHTLMLNYLAKCSAFIE